VSTARQYATEFIRANRVLRLPEAESDGAVVVGMVDPDDRALHGLLERYHGVEVRVRTIGEPELVAGLSRLVGERYGQATGDAVGGDGAGVAIDALSPAMPAVGFVNALLYDALDARASDVHLETDGGTAVIRYRIDGMLQTARRYEQGDFSPVVSRLKVMAHATVSERRLPQEGRFSFEAGGAGYDVRASFLPCDRGESVAIRLLETAADERTLTELGLRGTNASMLASVDLAAGGLVAVGGPTGSGKTTTIHALVRGYCDGTRKILTVEDPVEYRLPGVMQVQVRRDLGLDFDAVLRRALRHDPDVLVVGEIRDAETAALAVRGALSGHPVFSTIHTPSTAGIPARLENLGVPPHLQRDVMAAAVSQRLVRRVCRGCATEREATSGERERAARSGVELSTVCSGAGCRECRGTGFRGRLGIFEVETGARRGPSLEAEAWQAVSRGETTPWEVARAVVAGAGLAGAVVGGAGASA
jgi:type II secretory ATPase GspE/PulE/Tfp pilus assembly ATPase PilB-like protein